MLIEPDLLFIIFLKFSNPVKKGLDQVVNVVLANTEERVFTSEGIDKQQLGLYLIRGDNVAIVG